MEQNLKKIGKYISELGIENSKELVNKVDDFVFNLNEAKKKVYLLRKRYDKDTINIGVSGFTHAGKSTLLQAISGLTDEELPKADEFDDNGVHPTTAICSQIFNSEEKRAEITFKTESEFVDFINAHLKLAGIDSISAKGDVLNIEIPQDVDSEPLRNNVKERLRLIQESYNNYKKFIDADPLPIKGSEFYKINSFVSYSKGDKSLRFFPAAKEAKIYCPFPSLENCDTKLCLVDLPGFGEFDEVDKIQTQNLKEIVDHVVFIYKTNKDELISNRKYRDSFNTIINIHEFQKDNNEFLLKFLSFFINEDCSYPPPMRQVQVKQAKEGVAKFGKYNYSVFSALKKSDNDDKGTPDFDRAKEYLNNDILANLIETLPIMDDILLDSLANSFDIDSIKYFLKDLTGVLNTIAVQNEDAGDFHSRGRIFRSDFTGGLNDLLKDYQKNFRQTDKEFEAKINNIKKSVDKQLAETLFLDAKGPNSWEKFIEREMRLKGGLDACFSGELHRLWVEIINNYEQLDNEYNEKLKVLKFQVLGKFAELTSILVDNKEADNFAEVIDKLSIIKDNQIYKAFVSLDSLKQDFRQNIYPFLFKNKVNNKMERKGDMENTPWGEADLDVSNLTISSLREQLVTIGEEANYQISNVIKENYISSHFLIGALHTFKERIAYVNTDSDKDFIKFCSIFRKQIYPDEFGSNADNVKLQELKKIVEETKNEIKNI